MTGLQPQRNSWDPAFDTPHHHLIGAAVVVVLHVSASPFQISFGPSDLRIRFQQVRLKSSGIDAIEGRIRAAVPIAAVIYLEPDIDRSPVEAR